MKKVKMCELCGKEPASVPDRNRPGRLINRICRKCHNSRLKGDMQNILIMSRKYGKIGCDGEHI